MKEDIISIYNKYYSTIFKVSFILLKNKDDADDIAQTTFIKLLESNTVFENDNHIKAWLIKTCTNLSKNFLVHWSRKNCSIDTVDESFLSSQVKSSDVLNSVFSLPNKYKIAIYLYYYEGYNSMEIAKILNKRPSTIRSQLKKGRDLLRKHLQ